MVATDQSSQALVSAASLARLVDLAHQGGCAAMAHYHPGLAVEQKGDRGPVTAADRAAHAAIVTALAEWTPSIPIVSEEGDVPPAAARADWNRFWLVDPLDGTKEFINRNGEFTVNIALIQGGIPVLGVIHAPALGLTYWGRDGLGAWRQRGAAPPERVWSTPPDRGQPLRVAESRSHPSPALEAWLGTVPVASRVPVGSSLKFCLVAEGTADVYPRLGPTMEWDVAAGDCIFRNSGPSGPRSSSLVYNQPDLRNPGFVLGLEY